MPEARITLAHATVAAATAPKSNAAYLALDEAVADVRAGKGGLVPPHLRDAHYAGAKAQGFGQGYRYAHDFPHGVAQQQYLPDDLAAARYNVLVSTLRLKQVAGTLSNADVAAVDALLLR